MSSGSTNQGSYNAGKHQAQTSGILRPQGANESYDAYQNRRQGFYNNKK